MNKMFVAFNLTKLPPLPTSKNKKIKNINMQKFAILFRGNDPDAEEISLDDEIYLNQLIEPNDFKNEQDNNNNNDDVEIILEEDPIEPIDIDYTPVIMDSETTEPIQQQEPEQVEDEPLQIQHQSNRPTRSTQSKKRRNKKRTELQRKHRYRHSITRRAYNRFSMCLIRKILRLYNICYTHVKMDEQNDLIIGLKDRRSKNEAEQNLSTNIFSKRSYFYYRKLY
ncbi:unnamed protein product [Rotaria sp. Silwood2]|nr:unnamed protein product [Rotaria sp. Silwood2]